MTDQARDSVLYRGREWALAGVAGWGLFAPQDHGLQPVGTATFCWRGYLCTYALGDAGRLTLAHLQVSLGENAGDAKDVAPSLLGYAPRKKKRQGLPWAYELPDHPVEFTGGLLLGVNSEPDWELDQWRYNYPGADFAEVVELVFDEGLLLSAFDRTLAFEELREQFASSRPRHAPRSMVSEKGKEAVRAWEAKHGIFAYNYPS